MAIEPIVDLKRKFETGDRPTGADYSDLIDTLVNNPNLATGGNNDLEVSGIENATVLESLPAADWRMLKYTVSISKTSGGDNKFYATELSVLIDGQNLNVSQYGVIDNDGDMGTVDVSRNGGNIQLIVTPNPAVRPVTVRFARIGLKA